MRAKVYRKTRNSFLETMAFLYLSAFLECREFIREHKDELFSTCSALGLDPNVRLVIIFFSCKHKQVRRGWENGLFL